MFLSALVPKKSFLLNYSTLAVGAEEEDDHDCDHTFSSFGREKIVFFGGGEGGILWSGGSVV